MMKTALKFIFWLLVGGLIGLLLGGLIVVAFTDTTWSEYINKYYSLELTEGLTVFLVAVGSMIVSLLILVPLHELGHLVCGLLTGYKFVSFRIFNYTIIRIDGKIRVKKFAVAGTGGQCLLTPPDLPIEEIPTGWYNFGGVLANIVVLVIVIPLFLLPLNPFVAEALGVFAAMDFLMILLNGIPMQAGGVGNDGYNMKLLKRNLLSRQGIVNQLRANALIQNGVRPKDMPEDLYLIPEDHDLLDSAKVIKNSETSMQNGRTSRASLQSIGKIDYRNALEVSIPLMHSSRLVDEMKYAEALECLESMYGQKEEIMPLYVKEIACELAFLYLRTGQLDKASGLLDKDLRKYIDAYRKTMSSKERLLCAIALYLDKDESKARKIFTDLESRRNEYLLQGEVSSDLALMEDMLHQS